MTEVNLKLTKISTNFTTHVFFFQNFRSSGNQLGLFDLTSSSNGHQNQAAASASASAAQAASVEVGRLKDELLQTRARMANWEEGLQQTRGACEVWKKEAAIGEIINFDWVFL